MSDDAARRLFARKVAHFRLKIARLRAKRLKILMHLRQSRVEQPRKTHPKAAP